MVSSFGRLQRALLLFAFHLLYHQLAWSYDLVSWLVSNGQWRRWTQTALPRIRGPRVLEIGPGPGHLLGDLAERGFEGCGLELSPQMAHLARRNLRKRGLPCSLVRGRAQAIPFADCVFDSVVLTFPAEYIYEAEAQQEIRRVLKTSGRLVIVDGALLAPRGLYGRLLHLVYRVGGWAGSHLPEKAFGVQGFAMRVEEDADEVSTVHIFVLDKTEEN